MRNALARMIVVLFVLPAALAVVAGCGKKEEAPPPSGGTYYTGPMKPKGAGAGAQQGSQQPP